ncbi:ATP-binding cassette domain-containing protein [Tropicimonas sediminicola]|uniref:Thiamine transport system ATP-binding protein n=1 Tax=Tropicimonas sediminicola TaxID=1031541 RepID=A0A239L9F3_9RHOB|nr:ATP-binding cassette domain-containing protein [Tropicimonas sediminicola]SNT26319.1 thiamine transport system ATP-binding protein [Tropicimonas sediminicola]
MLQLERLRLVQGDFELSADITITAPITALLGPSGAGKSTLLNTIAGFTPPTAGRVIWRGEEITPRAPMERPVAMLFQDNNLFPHLDVTRNLALALTRGSPTREARDRTAEALARVGLPGYENRKPSELSGGQQSRVALARVLLQARPLMLLDEPFAALGPALKFEMLDLVAEVAAENGLQVIMVSHDPQDAARIANEAAVVADGAVTPPEPTAELMRSPPPSLASYLGIDGTP